MEKSGAGEGTAKVYLDAEKGQINSDLSLGTDVGTAIPLKSNESLSCRGVVLHGAGFIVTAEQAKELGLGSISGLEKHIKPYRNGRDITGVSRNVMVIDLFGLRDVSPENSTN